MNRVISKLKLLPIHLLFWFLIWFFYQYFFGFNSDNEKYITWFSTFLIPITAINTYFTAYYLMPNYLFKKKYTLFFLYGVYALITVSYIISSAMFFGYIFLSELDFKAIPPLSASLPFILMSMYLVVIIVSAFKSVLHNYQTLEKQKTLENKYLVSQLELKKEQLKFLKHQIHPHFLFNTLNALYGLALKSAKETPEMILKLSSLLDYILYQIDKPKVLLIDEINHIEDYISLEKLRFQDALKITKHIEVNDNIIEIAPMLLIPFIENSFKHGKMLNDVLNVEIIIKANRDKMMFSIKNSIHENQEVINGIGLENLKKRLEMVYPNRYQLDFNQLNNEFIVQLEITK